MLIREGFCCYLADLLVANRTGANGMNISANHDLMALSVLMNEGVEV